MRVQRIDPDFLKRRDLLVVFFEFASTLSSSEPDPVSGSVGRAGKVRDFHEAFQQHRFIAVAPAPVGAEWFGDGGQDARGPRRFRDEATSAVHPDFALPFLCPLLTPKRGSARQTDASEDFF